MQRFRRLIASMTITVLQTAVFPALATAQAGAIDEALYLEVFINGHPTGLIANFVLRQEQHLAITTSELQELRIKPDTLPLSNEGLVDLDRCVGLKYHYDQILQIVRIEISDQGRVPFVVETGRHPEAKPTDNQASGAIVNYTLFGSTSGDPHFLSTGLQWQTNFSLDFDARAFSQYGIFSQTGLLNNAIANAASGIRLDSTWSYSDRETLITYRAGDITSSGLSWTRSLRLGGLQVQRNFGLRPDLVTLPMPQYRGTAALPSTVDIFVNNIKGYSGSVPAGPFQIQNLPVISGSGNQSIVIQDALGRQTIVNQPFYSSAKMLAGGLSDFSVETGFARRNYGVVSNDYDGSLAASGSLRYGANDWVTLETHSEGSSSLLNAGAAVNLLLASWGVASFAVAGSQGNAHSNGSLVAASLELGRGGYTFYARTERTTINYLDLASIPTSSSLVPGVSLLAPRPPRAIDQAAFSVPLHFDPSCVTISLTHMLDSLNNSYNILGMSYSRPLPHKASLFVTAFKDFDKSKSYGVFGGMTISLSENITASSSISKNGAGIGGGIEVSKSQPLETDSWGWKIRDFEGSAASRDASVSYRSSVGQAQMGVQQIGSSTRVTAQMDGAVAFVNGTTFFANRINDAFAIVDAGAPNVDVFYENRPIETTGSNGMALVPYLRAYQNNSISIDAKNLAADADVPSTKAIVVPSDRGATLVKFGISQDARNALVVIKDDGGHAIAPGSHARVDGGEEATIGYDGEVYLRGLRNRNVLLVDQAEGKSCRAEFEYRPTPGTRVVINDVVCR